MMRSLSVFVSLFFAGILAVSTCSSAEDEVLAAGDASGGTPPKLETLGPGLYAVLHTSLGDIIIRLYDERTPKTVANFMGLALGQKEWKDPETGDQVTRPLYKDLVFHRVIPRFMVQTGDPTGTGMGGPGYKFADEIIEGLNFDRGGLVAMANTGPNTNGSQFFITTEKAPWLNGLHTIFGEVVWGLETVRNISYVPRDEGNRPLSPPVLKSVDVKRVETRPDSTESESNEYEPAESESAQTESPES